MKLKSILLVGVFGSSAGFAAEHLRGGLQVPYLDDVSTDAQNPTEGEVFYDLTDNTFYGYDGTSWQNFAAESASLIGTIDGKPSSANGATIDGTQLFMQSADDTNPGLVSREQTELVDANTATGFTGGSFRCTRIGNVVTLTEKTQITWSSSSSPGSGSAIVPADCRPYQDTLNVYDVNSNGIYKVQITSGGVIIFRASDYTGTNITTTGTISTVGWSITYTVE